MSRRSNSTVPLLCNLCPKTPQFSDVSHLLTHISSKTHLSNRFKMQIRSQGEPEARIQLETFDNWYAENGIEDLLSDRLAMKEEKKRVKQVAPKTRKPLAGMKFDDITTGQAVSVCLNQFVYSISLNYEGRIDQTGALSDIFCPCKFIPTAAHMVYCFKHDSQPVISLSE
jgi:hypothetical protein